MNFIFQALKYTDIITYDQNRKEHLFNPMKVIHYSGSIYLASFYYRHIEELLTEIITENLPSLLTDFFSTFASRYYCS